VEGEAVSSYSALLEPSVHVPFNEGVFWVLGMGAGAAYTDVLTPELAAGFAMAPRTGLQLLLGRSGIFNIGARDTLIFSEVEITEDGDPYEGQTVLAFANAFDVQAGYTVMF
jgi:hypothetical protein